MHFRREARDGVADELGLGVRAFEVPDPGVVAKRNDRLPVLPRLDLQEAGLRRFGQLLSDELADDCTQLGADALSSLD